LSVADRLWWHNDHQQSVGGVGMSKPVEFWIALAAASLYVFTRSSDKPLYSRLSMTAISAALGYSLAPDIAVMTGRSELLAVVLITALIYLALDFASALMADRALLIDTLRKLMVRK